MPVQLTAAEIGQKYDSIAPWYDRLELIAELFVFRRLRRSWFRRATGDVLEIAVGTGRNLPYYPSTCHVTAIDVSDGMLRIAQQRAQAAGRVVQFERMNAEALAFPDELFDTVTSSLSTCTFPDPIVALNEMKRVCRRTGRILLFEHGRSSSGMAGRIQDRLADGHARRVGCHWNRETEQLIQDSGLTLVSDHRSMLGVLHLIEAAP